MGVIDYEELPREPANLEMDLHTIGADRGCAGRDILQSTCRRDVSASNHSASIGVAPAAT